MTVKFESQGDMAIVKASDKLTFENVEYSCIEVIKGRK